MGSRHPSLRAMQVCNPYICHLPTPLFVSVIPMVEKESSLPCVNSLEYGEITTVRRYSLVEVSPAHSPIVADIL